MPQLDTSTFASQLFWLLICFFAMFFIMSRFFVPRIKDIMLQRQNKIDDYLLAASEFKTLAEEKLEIYQKSIKKAQDKSEENMQKMQAEINALVEQAEIKSNQQLAQQLQQNKAEIAKLREEVLMQIEDISVDLGEKILSKIGVDSVSREDITKQAKDESFG